MALGVLGRLALAVGAVAVWVLDVVAVFGALVHDDIAEPLEVGEAVAGVIELVLQLPACQQIVKGSVPCGPRTRSPLWSPVVERWGAALMSGGVGVEEPRGSSQSRCGVCYTPGLRFWRRHWRALLLLTVLAPYAALEAYRANRDAISAFVESQPPLRDFRNRIRFWPPPERSLSCKPGPPSPIERFEAPGAVIDGKLYVFGGFTLPDLTASSRCDVFDPASGEWTRIGDLPAAVTHAAAVQDGRSVWFLGGFVGDHPGAATNAVWRYDADGDSWTPGPALPALRASGAAAILGRTLHFFGGSEGDRVTDSGDHWTLDLDHTQQGWQFAPPLPSTRHHLSAAALDGLIYAMGGQVNHDASGRDQARTDIFDPAIGEWRIGPSLPRPKAHFEPGTFFVDGRLCIVGGESGLLQALYDFHCLDARTGVWLEYPALPVQLRAPLVRPLGGRLFIVAGGGMPSGMEPKSESWLCELPSGPVED